MNENENLPIGYETISQSFWKGRIDSKDDYDAFRWHQWVQCINLNNVKKEDFKHKLGIVLIGFCSDIGVERNKGRTGTANGPNSIRKELMNRPCAFDKSLKIYDAGNITPFEKDLERAQKDLSYMVDRILNLGLFPIVLGGGHAVALGHYHGLNQHLLKNNKKSKLGIINFDAHFDIRPYNNGGTSGTMFRQIADYCIANQLSYNYLCLGIQRSGNTVDLFKTAHKLGAQYLLAKDIQNADLWGITEKIDDFIKQNTDIYMTICADVFSSANAPGVSAPQPLGIDPERAIKLIKHIVKSGKLLSFDIAEVSPRFDLDNSTASLAAVLIFSIVSTLASEHNLSIIYDI